MPSQYPFIIDKNYKSQFVDEWAGQFSHSKPFNHVVIDNFLSQEHVQFLSETFPTPDHPVWLDWKKRSPHQYAKLGPGGANNFHLLDPELRFALNEFNSSYFLTFLEQITGIEKLLPDPHYSGGGMHQILNGGILDIHTDFNHYKRLDIYRQLNVLIYLNEDWKTEYGGELELWDDSAQNGGKCVHSIAPLFNRVVIFKTDKTSFHGHPNEWVAPEPLTRRSLAFYYYTAQKFDGYDYDSNTDFQGIVSKSIPES